MGITKFARYFFKGKEALSKEAPKLKQGLLKLEGDSKLAKEFKGIKLHKPSPVTDVFKKAEVQPKSPTKVEPKLEIKSEDIVPRTTETKPNINQEEAFKNKTESEVQNVQEKADIKANGSRTPEAQEFIDKYSQLQKPDGSPLYSLEELDALAQKDAILELAKVENADSIILEAAKPENSKSYFGTVFIRELGDILKKTPPETKEVIVEVAKTNIDGHMDFIHDLRGISRSLKIKDKDAFLELVEMKNGNGVNLFSSCNLVEATYDPVYFLKKFKSLPLKKRKLIEEICVNTRDTQICINDFIDLDLKNLKLIKQVTSEPDASAKKIESLIKILKRDKAFVDTDYRYAFEELNELVHGKKPQWMVDKISAFENEIKNSFMERGIEQRKFELHVDNNINQDDLSEYMYNIKCFLDNNRVKNIESIPEIYITNFLAQGTGGCSYANKAICISLNNKYMFDEILKHENAHYRNNLKNPGIELRFSDSRYFDPKSEEIISKYLGRAATESGGELVGWLNSTIEYGGLHVVRNEETGKLVLRKYIKNSNNIEIPQEKLDTIKNDLDEIVRLYQDHNGPELVPTAPLITNLKCVDAVIPEKQIIKEAA